MATPGNFIKTPGIKILNLAGHPVTVFKENLNLELPLIFYSSIRWFVFERGFVSEPLAENRLESLLEIIDKFITKLFLAMILQFALKTVWEVS